MRTSYSALSTFKQCPQRYKFKIIDRLKEAKTKEQMFGTFIHDCLQFMFSRDPLFPTLDQVVGYYHLNFPSEKWDSTELMVYKEQGESMLRRFYSKNAPWNFAVLDTESRFEVVLNDTKTGSTHILAGVIDRVDKINDTAYEIIDYKTQKRIPSQERVDKDMQLSIYAMALKKRWPHIKAKDVKLSLQFLKHDEKLSTSRTEDDFKTTENDVLNTIHSIEERERMGSAFEPIVSPLCDFCGYKPLCPAWKHLYKNVAKDSVDGAKVTDLMKEFFELKSNKSVIEARLKFLAGLLTRYLEEEGIERVFSDNGIIAKRTLEKYTYDFEKIQAILEPLGKWQDILKADEARLKNIMREIPEWARDEIKSARVLARKSTILTATKKKATRLDSSTATP